MLFALVYVHFLIQVRINVSTFRLVGIGLVLGLELEVLVRRSKEHLPVQPC